MQKLETLQKLAIAHGKCGYINFMGHVGITGPFDVKDIRLVKPSLYSKLLFCP